MVEPFPVASVAAWTSLPPEECGAVAENLPACVGVKARLQSRHFLGTPPFLPSPPAMISQLGKLLVRSSTRTVRTAPT
eukprot:4623528-Pleurochrysis_carterae.AAC.1